MNWKQILGLHPPQPAGRFVGRARTKDDTAIKYRMGAGYAGDVNRTHPASIEPAFPDATNPPASFGVPVVVDSSSHNVRTLLASDNGADAIYGIVVRPYPTQQATATVAGAPATFNSGGPASNRVLDILRAGYIMVQMNSGGGTPAKGSRVYLWTATAVTGHALGGFETAACSGKTILLDEKSYYNGSADANGVVEVGFNI